MANASPRASPIQLIQSQLNTTNLFTAHLIAAAQNTGNGIEQFLASGVLVFKAAESNGKSRARFDRPENARHCRDEIKSIVEIQLKPLRQNLRSRKMALEITERAKALLADKGYDPVYGRPLKRTIQWLIQDPLAIKILEGEFKTAIGSR